MSGLERPGAVSVDRLVDALLSERPLPALEALRPELDGTLLDVADAAVARLTLRVPPAGSPAALLLLAVSGHPGCSLAELAAVAGLEDVAPVAASLLADGLVVDRRFDRTDCWARTSRGAQAVRVLRGQERVGG